MYTNYGHHRKATNTSKEDGFAAAEYLDADVEIKSVWEMIRDNIKISAKESLGYYEFRKHKPCSKLLEEIKQTKLQWLQNPSEKWG
jgi:hypothetical protein